MRFEARRLLPGMAARLRVVGQVPLLAMTPAPCGAFHAQVLQGSAYAAGSHAPLHWTHLH